MPLFTARRDYAQALRNFVNAGAQNPATLTDLKPQFDSTLAALFDDFGADQAVDQQVQVSKALAELPSAVRDAAPRVELFEALLGAEAARRSGHSVEALRTLLDVTKDRADWAGEVKTQAIKLIDAIDTLKPEEIFAARSVLQSAGVLWKLDKPFMILARVANTDQMIVNMYEAAVRINENNHEANAKLSGHYLSMGEKLEREEGRRAAERYFKLGYEKALKAATGGNPEGMGNLASALTLGRGVAANPEEAVKWATKADGLGYVSAPYHLGLAYLALGDNARAAGDRTRFVELYQSAATAFEKAGPLEAQNQHVTSPWYLVAFVYSELGEAADYKKKPYSEQSEGAKAVRALEKGAQVKDPQCLFELGKCYLIGHPYFPADNLTLGRGHLAEAAALGHTGAKETLRNLCRDEWSRGTDEQREWCRKNRHLWE
jgi:TPR repeat protein